MFVTDDIHHFAVLALDEQMMNLQAGTTDLIGSVE